MYMHISVENKPRSRFPGLKGRCVFSFTSRVFKNGQINLFFHQHCERVLDAVHHHYFLKYFQSSILVIVVDVTLALKIHI